MNRQRYRGDDHGHQSAEAVEHQTDLKVDAGVARGCPVVEVQLNRGAGLTACQDDQQLAGEDERGEDAEDGQAARRLLVWQYQGEHGTGQRQQRDGSGPEHA